MAIYSISQWPGADSAEGLRLETARARQHVQDGMARLSRPRRLGAEPESLAGVLAELQCFAGVHDHVLPDDAGRYGDRPYLYNADLPLHQRAAMVLKLLNQHTKLTVADAVDIAVSTQVYNADQWQGRLAAAWEGADAKLRADAKTAKLCELILRWNRRADADSTGAIAYRYWIDQLPGKWLQGICARANRCPRISSPRCC